MKTMNQSGTRQPTEFEWRVFRAVQRIPRGKVSTYGEVAGYIGCGSSRAVGQALGRNPFAPRVPCHRVIAADLTLGGFAGKTRGPRLRDKKRLLSEEGVIFEGRRLAASCRDRIYRFPCPRKG